ncbi:hypothetical protein, partial [Pseudomonas gessardii]
MPFTLAIPTPTGSVSVTLESGTSAIFVGANGGGKSRLAVYLEEAGGEAVHRISAHRALELNPDVAKIKESHAVKGLRFGHSSVEIHQRSGYR